eukprot:m.197358 g.197358  ORF g.197358 m.197358 type:complete len:323 (+) comp18715_c0_seq1:198-1166(+)
MGITWIESFSVGDPQLQSVGYILSTYTGVILTTIMGGAKSKHVTKSDPSAYWTIKGDLGAGNYGKVHLVQNRQNRTEAAAKVAELDSEAGLQEFAMEIHLLATCRHPNITSFMAAYYFESKLWIIIEKCDGGAIGDLLSKRGSGMTVNELKVAGAQMLDAITFLHSKNVVHRDLNAANTLLSGDGLIKIADFGVSAQSKGKRHTFIGSPNWMAPEVVKCEQDKSCWYVNSCDIWGLGVTMIEFADGQPPYSDLHPVKVLLKIVTSAPPKVQDPSAWPEEFSSLLSQMLQKEPEKRPSASDLRLHPFVAGQQNGSLVSLLPSA